MILIPIIIAILVAGWFYRKTIPELNAWQKNLLWLLRSCSLIVIMMLLFNPILSFFSKNKVQQKVLFLHDNSESMDQIGKRISKSNALQNFNETLRTKLIEKGFEVEDLYFSDELNGNRNATYLGKSFNQITKTIDLENVEEIYLFSDGWFQDDNLNFIDKLDLPVNTFAPVFKFVQSDLEISSINFPKTTYKEDLTPFFVNIAARNFNDKAVVNLTSGNKIIQTRKVDFSKNSIQNINFEYSFNKTGLNKLNVTISADSLEELNLTNNTITTAIQVLENRQKCLIISDKLVWEIRFLNNAIKSHPHWEIVYLSKKNILKKANSTVHLNNEIKDVNTLILVNDSHLKFSKTEREIITNFVSNGGGLLFMGKEISSLDHLLPSAELNLKQTFIGSINLTDQSNKYQTFRLLDINSIKDIPPVDYYYVKPKLQAEILAEITNEQSSAAILYMDFNQGKIMQCPFFGIWKWQLRSADGSYNNFFSDLIIWLGTDRSDLFYAYTDNNSYYSSETIMINLSAYDETMKPRNDVKARIKLYASDNAKKPIHEKFLLSSNSQYYTEFEQLEPDEYSYLVSDEVTDSESKDSFVVLEDNIESRDFGFNYSLLAYIAEQTNGKYMNFSETENNVVKESTSRIFTNTNEIPIYKKWYVIALFLICFCLELYLRKRWGLL
jgi:hypothetical protein